MNKNIFVILLMFFVQGTLSFAQKNNEKKHTVRILTFNIYHGETMKGNYDLDLFAGIIKKTNPDLVALQEVDFKTKRAKGYDLATELGQRTGMAPLFGSAMPYDGGQYGVALLSRWSLINSNLTDLPKLNNNEPRVALMVTVATTEGDTINFISTHFSNESEKNRILQAESINAVIQNNKYPAILAGDLNALPGSETIKQLENEWTPTHKKTKPAFTYPADNPHKKIDYIMYSPANRWKVIKQKTICNPVASDHCAYFAILELN